MGKQRFKINGLQFFFSWIAVLCLAITLKGCTNQNPLGPSQNSVHPSSYADPGFLGTFQFHGTDTAENGTQPCLVCHGADLNGTDTISGCYECHFDLDGSREPDDSDWIHGTNPHSDLGSQSDTCNRCHDYMRDYGYAPAACHDCHDQGASHPLGQPWLDIKSRDFHGDMEQSSCGDCHDLAVKCYQCHFGETGRKSPPGSGWPHGSISDHEKHSGYISICNQCHTLNRSYGNPPSRCHDCHDD